MGMDASATICYGIEVDFDKIEDIHEELIEGHFNVGCESNGSPYDDDWDRNHAIYVKGTRSFYDWDDIGVLSLNKINQDDLDVFNQFCKEHLNISPKPKWLVLCNYG